MEELLEDGCCDIFNMCPYSALVRIVDRCNGFVLLKNELWMNSEKVYSVGVQDDDGLPKIVETKEPWVNANNADKIMRSILKRMRYNKATKDWEETLRG